METIQKFKCEICNKDYTLPQEAMKCEARGKESLVVVPGHKVLLKQSKTDEAKTFYVACIIAAIRDKGHYYEYDLDIYDETGFDMLFEEPRKERILGLDEDEVIVLPDIIKEYKS